MKFFIFTLSFFISQYSFAAENGRILPNGFGIASPSVTTILHGYENPAGHAHISSFKMQLLGYASENTYNPLVYSGGLFLGNGSMGGGVAGVGNSGTGVTDTDTDYLWGLGIDLSSLGVTMGLNGTTTSGANSETHTKWGILFGGKSKITFGVVIDSDDQNTYDIGGGFSFDISSNVNFSIDALHYRSDTQISYAAGLHVGANIGEFLVGYKIVDKASDSETHMYGGLALTYWQSLSIEFLYNYLSKYCLGLTYKF